MICSTVFINCASKKTPEEIYTPSAKIIEIKQNTPLYKTWNRWDESNSSSIIVGNKISEFASLESILADDPHSDVVNKMKDYLFYKNASRWCVSFGLLGFIFSYQKKSDGDERYLNPDLATPSALLFTLGMISLNKAENLLEEARSIHNNRLNSLPFVSYTWSFQ